MGLFVEFVHLSNLLDSIIPFSKRVAKGHDTHHSNFQFQCDNVDNICFLVLSSMVSQVDGSFATSPFAAQVRNHISIAYQIPKNISFFAP